ncbi:hypothetical protein C7S14_2613 [Burkholderia cepacia]|nr:hypothetical protein C7S14_2613 [Burkholderia cepacia]
MYQRRRYRARLLDIETAIRSGIFDNSSPGRPRSIKLDR